MSDGPEGRVPPHNLDAEASVLGGILLRNGALSAVTERGVEPDDFYHPAHRAIFEVMLALDGETQPIDIITVADALKQNDRGRGINAVEGLLADLAARVPTAENIGYYARIVHEKSSLRRMIGACTDVAGRAFSDSGETAQFLDWAEGRVYQVASRTERQSYVSITRLLPDTVKEIEKRYQQKRNITGVPTEYTEFDKMTAGLQPGELIVLAARPSMGKAQPLDAPVKTPTGWTRMGELRLGDELASVDGRRSRVSGIFPQGDKQIFRVTFSDGRSAECCEEHLWRVYRRDWPAPRVLALAEIRRLLQAKRNQGRLWIETASGDFGHREPLPLDPWVLGALLGDGSLLGTQVRFSSMDAELLARLLSRAPGHELRALGGCDYRVVTAGGSHRTGVAGVVPNALKESLRTLGLWNVRSEGKFVPPQYLSAHREARLELLRGLMDTDGWVESWGSLRFATASERLAQDVVELTRSLGGMASVSRKSGAGGTSYCVKGQSAGRLTFRSIAPTRVAPAQCITVTHPAHLYVTEQYVVTHNTALALNIAQNAALAHKIPVLVFSLEMSRHSLVERMLCAEARIDSQRLRGGFIEAQEWLRLTQAMARLSEAPIFIDDSPAPTGLELRAKARRWRGDATIFPDPTGLGLVMVDYLQMVRGQGNEERKDLEIGEISRGFKALAKELRVPVLALSQLNRSVEKRDDKRPQLSDLRECVTGETLVVLSDGRRVPIRELVGTTPEVIAAEPDGRLRAAPSDKVWRVGKRKVYRVTLATGRLLRATGRHRLLGARGFVRVSDLSAGDELRAEAASELFWDTVAEIVPDGVEDVFDLTVPGPATWLADGVVSHNSGAIEQDADLICFIYRDAVYRKREQQQQGRHDEPIEDENVAEIIIGKQRNGPTGTVKLFFAKQFTRFENLARGRED